MANEEKGGKMIFSQLDPNLIDFSLDEKKKIQTPQQLAIFYFLNKKI